MTAHLLNAGVLGQLADTLGDCPQRPMASPAPDEAWAGSGAMSLTGPPGRPLLAPSPLSLKVLDLGARLSSLTDRLGSRVDIDPLGLLTERAGHLGLSAAGATSCGGRSRLLPCLDAWLVVSLVRDSDFELVPVWLEREGAGSWEDVAREVRSRRSGPLVSRARLLGMAVAAVGSVASHDRPAVRPRRVSATPADALDLRDALVVDLSSLWAGPLCGHLLTLAGARVVKVESHGRPDGARSGNQDFFNLLHQGQESLALDFGSPKGRADLRLLLESADIVIEASRPRALRQLGIHVDEVLERGRGRAWLSLTGYGASGPAENWIAFGDDAAAAGGLVAWDGPQPCFCADAVADPATGLIAAIAALAACTGGCWHLDVAMAGVAAWLADGFGPLDWRPAATGDLARVTGPRLRTARGPAPAPGRDTESVLTELRAQRRD